MTSTPTPPCLGEREAVARTDELAPEEIAEIMAEEPPHQPAPPPTPVRDRYYLTECEHCGWIGSSEHLGVCDDDISCPVCCQSICGDGPDEADTAKHGEAVYQRIVTAEAAASTLRTENETLRAEVETEREAHATSARERNRFASDASTLRAERDAAIARAEEAEEGTRDARYKADCAEEDECDALSRAEEAESKLATLTAKLAQAEGEIATMRTALQTIAEEHDAGRHDGLPEACPAHEAEVMWAVARAALTTPEPPMAIEAEALRAPEETRVSAWRQMKDAPTGVPIVAKHKPNDATPHGWIATILLGHDDEEAAGSLDTILHYNGNALYRGFHGCWDGWMTCEEAGSLIHRSALAEDTARAAEGMRSAFAKVLLIQARELKRLAPDGETPADLDAAMADLRAALPLTNEAAR